MMTLQQRYSWKRALVLLYLVLQSSSAVVVAQADDQRQHHHTGGGVLEALRRLQETLSPQHKPRKEKKKRLATRRRALLEYTLTSHYQGSTEHHLHSPLVQESSWGHAPCVFYNEFKSSYWTYQWCLSQKVSQAHWILTKDGDYRADVSHSLGSFTTKVSQNKWPAHDGDDVEYFEGGDECVVQHSDDTTSTVQRRTLVIKNPQPQCSEATDLDEWRIVAVTEPSPCTYILYACGPLYHNASRKTAQKASADLKKTVASSTSTTTTKRAADSTVLQTYLEEADAAATSTSDRTISWHAALPPLPPSRLSSNLSLIREMFTHAYDSYMYHAFPASEIQPLTCTPGTFSLVKLPALTLVDSLDTLIIMGNTTEFARSVERLRPLSESMFAVNQNVSVFETNIRVLGGLLSAHQLAEAFVGERDIPANHIWDADGNVRIGPIPMGSEKDDDSSCLKQCMVNQFTLDVNHDTCSAKKDNTTTTTTCSTFLKFWKYDGILLKMALNLGTRLLPAFDTPTGIPYGTVNLLHGIPHGETKIASLAGGGTLSLEFELLSRLSGIPEFGRAAKLASRSLWLRRSKLNLLGKHISIDKGEWTETLSGIGSNSDSFYEYLLKHYLLFGEEDFWTMFGSTYIGIVNNTRMGEWYPDVDMNAGARFGGSRKVFESLQAFLPGMQTLVGELGPAARSLNSFFLVREFLGFLPERFNYASWKVDGPGGAAIHPLRPELLESCYFMHRSTKNPNGTSGWLWAADFSLHTLNELTDTTCGYATVKDISSVTTGTIPPQDSEHVKLANEMPSFFLSETLKYLYLTFDETNVLHMDTDREWIFTTEAHPIHYVPMKKTTTDDSVSRRKQVEALLERRLSGRRQKTDKSRTMAAELALDKWTANTPLTAYTSNLRHVKAQTLLQQYEPPLFRQYLVLQHSQEVNLAYQSFGDMGMGSSLRKSCPNFYRSSLLWIRALNGGVLDYSDHYVSSVSDALYNQGEEPEALSAAQALSYHGTGVYLGKYTDPQACKIQGDVAAAAPTETTVTQKEENPVQRYDMGGEEGEFEISAFADGFSLKHVKTGELLIATVVIDDTEESNPFVMAYLIKPQFRQDDDDDRLDKTWKLGKTNWRAFFGRKASESPMDIVERAVVVNDVHNRAFRCEIQMVSGDDEESEPLATFPCAPALFGPTRLQHLGKQGGLEVSGDIHLPDPSDESGCAAEGDADSPRAIQLVRRGSCTFQFKAANQKSRSGAEGVIIINNADDELFLMSDSGHDEVREEDTPTTVLVTKNDGDEMIAAIKEGNTTFARVRLLEQEGDISATGEASDTVDWPIVRTSSDRIVQIFSESGWGVHAMYRQSAGDSNEWQLFLMRHKGGQ